jgi:hypothetical protein
MIHLIRPLFLDFKFLAIFLEKYIYLFDQSKDKFSFTNFIQIKRTKPKNN